MAGIPWMDEELEFLKNNYLQMSCDEISKHLPLRTTRAVQHKFGQLGLERPLLQVGDKINLLTILETYSKNIGTQNVTYARCKCDCGNEVITKLTSIASENTKSCGCLRDEKARQRCIEQNTTHGASNDHEYARLYRIYLAMRRRCYSKNSKCYPNYGKRGITVCQEWLDNYLTFKNWSLSNGYDDTKSIDRIDVNGNYCPENCQWASNIVQANNKRSNVYVEAWGERKTLAEWTRDHRCNASNSGMIKYRITAGWKPENAISTPKLDHTRCYGEAGRNANLGLIKAFGENKTISQWLRDDRCKLNHAHTFYNRLAAGWHPEDIIIIPDKQ